MELAISAVTGELVSRFLSLLVNKYHSSRAYSEEKQLKRLEQLILRARTVVEEADGRYITNSGMLEQLNMLAEALYQGYWALGAFRYRSLEETPIEEEEEVSNSSPPKRLRTFHASARKKKAPYLLELQGALESLEDAVSSMKEFVIILGGCDRMLRRPYDAYLYNDNIMFGRHAEKQKLLNFLLQHGSPGGAPAVIPVIGGPAVGKRTLVAHVCKDEREVSAKFCSTLASMDSGSKVIIVSRSKSSEKLATVKPIFLNTLPYEEFSYLFKTLAFGSSDPAQHPQLARIADEMAREMQSGWSLVAANLLADVMRRNLNIHFWLSMLSRMRRFVERNFSMFGEHPQLLVLRRHQIDVTDFFLHPASPLRILPSCTTGSSRTEITEERQLLPNVRLGDLVVDTGAMPQGDFNVVSWESRVPPYTSFVHFASIGGPSVAEDTPLCGRKRKSI